MSVGISDRFVQRGMQGRIIVIVCETGIEAELDDTQLIGRQFVHRGEDLLHGTHDRRLQNKWSRSNLSIMHSPRRAPLQDCARSCIITSFAKASACQERFMMIAPIVVIGHGRCELLPLPNMGAYSVSS